jgi:hypothetical protein
MERSPEMTPDESPVTARKSKAPLWQKMYFQQHMIAIVRLMGYDELTLDDARERLRPLLEVHGKALIEEGAAELLTINVTHTSATARLSDEARALAIQILGRPKDQAAALPSPASTAGVNDQAVPPPVDPEANAQPRARRRCTARRPTGSAAGPTAEDQSTTADTDGAHRSAPKKRAKQKRDEAAP